MHNRHRSYRHGILPLLLSTVMLCCGCSGTPDRSHAGAPSNDSGDVLEPDETGTESTLVGTVWRVEDIVGHGIVDDAQTTVRFEEEGRVSGSTGCNRYTGSVAVQADTIRFGPLASTRRACAKAQMDQEQKFLAALEQVRGYAIDPGAGWLELRDEEKSLMRLSRKEEP